MRFCTALCAFLLCGCRAEIQGLEPLIGRWTASDPRFEQCAIGFSPEGWLVFEQGDGQMDVCRVQEVAVEVAKVANTRCFRVRYEGARDGESSLSLMLEDAGVMRLRNRQDVAWKKSEAAR